MTAQRCAQILNGVVENVIEADPVLFVPSDGSTLVPSATAEIGWTYANGAFTPVAPAVSYQTTGLTFDQFMALFTAAEQAAINTSTDTQTRVFIAEAEGAPSIDLTNPTVTAGVNYLASINLIASSRVATILAGAPAA
jgi:hypothetical protein